MTIAPMLQKYLADHEVAYGLVHTNRPSRPYTRLRLVISPVTASPRRSYCGIPAPIGSPSFRPLDSKSS
jgi:hypothetical protein